MALLAGCATQAPPPASDAQMPAAARVDTFLMEGEAVTVGPEGGPYGEAVELVAQLLADLDGDGVSDRAVVLVLISRGSGNFYYLNVVGGQDGAAHEAFLGDRLRFDALAVEPGEEGADVPAVLRVRFGDRSREVPFAAPPDVDHDLRFTFDGDVLSQR